MGILHILGLKKSKPFKIQITLPALHVTLTDADTLQTAYRALVRNLKDRKKCTGFCHRAQNVIWVNAERTSAALEKGLGHELIHLLFPDAEHDDAGIWWNLGAIIERLKFAA